MNIHSQFTRRAYIRRTIRPTTHKCLSANHNPKREQEASEGAGLILADASGCEGRRRRGRRGVVVICALVCLSVATAMIVTTVHHALSARRQGYRQWQLRQTQYLLDAGIRRAFAGLAADGAYAGESWRPAGALPGFETVVVEVDIKPLGDEPARQQVTVLAQIGRDESLASQTQRSQTFVYSPAEPATSLNPN